MEFYYIIHYQVFGDELDLDNEELLHLTYKLKICEQHNLLLVLTFHNNIVNSTKGEKKNTTLSDAFLIFLVLCSIFSKICSWGKEQVRRRMGEGSDFIFQITKNRFEIINFQGHQWRIHTVSPFQQFKYSTCF